MKQSKWMRMLSLLVCLSLLLTMNSATALASESLGSITVGDTVTEMTTGNPIHTWTVTDREESFPLNIQPAIDLSTVEYHAVPVSDIPSEELITVDVAKLRVGLSISLKEVANIQGSYKLTICKDDEMVLNGVYDEDDIVTVDALVYNEGYSISVETETSDSYIEYMGNFYYGVDVGNEVFYSMEYKTFKKSKTEAQNDSVQYETESNNVQDSADRIYGTDTWYGTICDTDEYETTTTDVDWFYRDAIVLKQTQAYIYVKNYSSGTLSMDISYYEDVTGQEYPVDSVAIASNGVYVVCHDIEEYKRGKLYIKFSARGVREYAFSVDVNESPVWYSQRSGTIGNYSYWNTHKLEQTYFSNKQFINNLTSDEVSSSAIMATACGLVSAAMIFRNAGRQSASNLTDFRTGVSGKLGADPYTVYLVNIGASNPQFTFSDNKYKCNESAQSAVNSWASLAKGFGYNGYQTVDETSDDPQTIRNRIGSLLDAHPEGIVMFVKKNDSKKHFIAVTGYSSHMQTDSNGETHKIVDAIFVCDANTVDASKGKNVSYENCRSFSDYGWSLILRYFYFT